MFLAPWHMGRRAELGQVQSCNGFPPVIHPSNLDPDVPLMKKNDGKIGSLGSGPG